MRTQAGTGFLPFGPPLLLFNPVHPPHPYTQLLPLLLPLSLLPFQNRLAFLTNKCSGEEDLEYYIMEAGNTLGVKIPDNGNAKVRRGEAKDGAEGGGETWTQGVCVRKGAAGGS